jgi:hypothetical protein
MKKGLLLLTLAALPLAPQSVEPKLKAELEPMAFFLGSWSCEGHFVSGNRPIAAVTTFQADLNGAWLLHRHDDRPPNPFHALEMWGFDRKAKEFIALIHDSGGGIREFRSPGWADQRWIWTGDTLAASRATQRFIFEKKAETQFVMSYEVSRTEDTWSPVDSVTCTRQ